MPDFSAHIGQSRKNAFLLTDDPSQVAKSLTPEVAVAGVDRAGDEQAVSGLFYGVGRAVATVANPQVDYGGADGVTGDAMLAEYVPPKGQIASVVAGQAGSAGLVYPLDRLGKRNALVKPFIVGKNIALLCDPTKPSNGVVVRGSLLGDPGFDAHVYIASPDPKLGQVPPIILHHWPPNAPVNSTIAYDPDGNSKRAAPLSDSLRIRGGVNMLCPGTTAPPDDGDAYWVYLNGTQHGGNRLSGFLAATFANAEALLSREGYGPLRPATELHEFAVTTDLRSLRAGALDCDSLFTRGNPEFDAPLWIEDEEEPEVMEPSGHAVRVHCQHDKDGKNGPYDHGFMCRPTKRRGMRKWWVKQTVTETPPCKGQKPGKPTTGPPAAALPALPMAYFVGSHMANGIGFLSHPGA